MNYNHLVSSTTLYQIPGIVNYIDSVTTKSGTAKVKIDLEIISYHTTVIVVVKYTIILV